MTGAGVPGVRGSESGVLKGWVVAADRRISCTCRGVPGGMVAGDCGPFGVVGADRGADGGVIVLPPV